LQERTQQQRAVAELGQKALAGDDLPALLEEAVAHAATHLQVDYAVLSELLPAENNLLVKTAIGWQENLVGRKASLTEGSVASNRLLHSAEPVVIADHSKVANLHYELPLPGQPIASSVSVAINGQDFPYGVLSVLSQKRRHFTPDDVAYLQAIANILAEAISRKRGEEEREQLLAREHAARVQAEEANQLKDEFLATLSHELRTPLNSMLGWVLLLRDGRLSAEKAAEALATIERNVRAQNRLVEDLLDVSRIVTGRMQLHIQTLVPAKIVEAALASLRPAAQAKGVHLQIVIDSQPGEISGDPDRLQQVVWNLVSNAIKFTPQGGKVQVRLERVNSHVEISVSDTGEGITSEFLPHVFARFSQADGSFTRRYGGLGLGLAIVRHLVELHGGTVHAHSPGEGQGATFKVVLPLTAMPVAMNKLQAAELQLQSALPGADGPRLHGTRVLIVDDEADARRLLTMILSGAGAEVRTASSLQESLELLAAWRPDVLVSDIGMPDGDGYSLIQEVRQTEASGAEQRLPAVALTAFARTEDRLRALAAGFQMHVAKPVEPEELLMVVASLTGRLAQG
jgi:signal transduction histidine kinase/CheY-like chemotaxis protein